MTDTLPCMILALVNRVFSNICRVPAPHGDHSRSAVHFVVHIVHKGWVHTEEQCNRRRDEACLALGFLAEFILHYHY